MATLPSPPRSSNQTSPPAQIESDSELQHVESVEVVVEERRVAFGSSNNWRSYKFTGLATIPERLDAAFGDPDLSGANGLFLLHRVKEVCKARKSNVAFEEPYREVPNNGRQPGATVLRSVRIAVRYRAAGEEILARSGAKSAAAFGSDGATGSAVKRGRAVPQ